MIVLSQWRVAASDGTLDTPCLSEGKCSVAHAYCIHEVCKCMPDYFDKDGVCCESIC